MLSSSVPTNKMRFIVEVLKLFIAIIGVLAGAVVCLVWLLDIIIIIMGYGDSE